MVVEGTNDVMKVLMNSIFHVPQPLTKIKWRIHIFTILKIVNQLNVLESYHDIIPFTNYVFLQEEQHVSPLFHDP